MEGKPCPTCGKRLKPEALWSRSPAWTSASSCRCRWISWRPCSNPSRGDFRAHAAGAATDKEATRRDRAERAGRAVHAVSPDVRRTSALSEEKAPRRAQPLAGGVMARLRPAWAGFGLPDAGPSHADAFGRRVATPAVGPQLSSLLFGVVYVLDEPSAGLHPSDSQALYDARPAARCG